MARNGSGTYSLPEDPFVFDTVIEETKVNANFSDIATEITNSIDKDGQTPITGILQHSVAVGQTANTGSVQGNNPITTEFYEIATCANAGDAVTLPTAKAGQLVIIVNNGANSADVFPASGDKLDGGSVNAAFSLSAGANALFICQDDTDWDSLGGGFFTPTSTNTLTNKSLTAPIITGSSSAAGTVLFKEDTDNGTNSCTLSGPQSTADVTVTLPAATDTLVGKATTDTLTNKTLTAPVISGSSSAAGVVLFKEDTDNGTNSCTLSGPQSTADVTVTLPASTDTLVGKATTDTLTNKTLTAPVLNNPTFDVSVGVTAHTGSAQGNGAITSTFVEIATCANAGDAVTLPSAAAGKLGVIANNGSNSADVFPASGDAIDGASANAAFALAAGSNRIFICQDGTDWDTIGGSTTELSDDSSPVLGADLDVGSYDITSASNADVDINPNGTGNVVLKTDLVSVGGGSEVGHVSSNSTQDLKLSTNSGTTSGTIIITDGANGAITITPNGSGIIDLPSSMNPTLTSTGKALVLGF